MPALDGLRALAVMAVVLYHGEVSGLPGGFLGVEIFFVISGYLITALLISERQRTGGVAYLAFWARRARRLLPALFALAGVVGLVWVLFVPGELARIRGDFVASLTYVTNWYQILVHQSYFEAIGRPSPLRHLWSLAVEEQFYLVWPVTLAVLSRVTRGHRGRLALITGGLAIASSVWAIILFTPGVDPSRVYYGTDTRAAGVLLGAVLAIVVPPWEMHARVKAGGRWIIIGIGALGLGRVAAGFFSFPFAVTATWIGNRRFTFSDAPPMPAARQLAKFAAVCAVGLIFNRGTYSLLVSTIPFVYDYPIIGLLAGTGVSMFFNFFASRRHVFGR